MYEAESRIIPARAGFTTLNPVLYWSLTDHPRSRGVYSAHQSGCRSIPGSSPLARGLPSPCPRRGSGHKDHPRSRGVYGEVKVAERDVDGSSPLARGLHGREVCEACSDRIIPARAGFTYSLKREHVTRKDHPRSRGVYGPPRSYRRNSAGSSPLARGLPGAQLGVDGLGRIIPARAGFTRAARACSSESRDHPRSRGVYPGRPPGGRLARGSSPLARGLRRVGRGVPRHRGIIPARAGFTARRAAWASPGPDHPRSRGVYYMFGSSDQRHTGSSPLARGLREAGVGGDHRRGIIPARAGFTSGTGTVIRSHKDHPRSRGVYGKSSNYWRRSQGSSPLARGLPTLLLSFIRDFRIIPARAGFTSEGRGGAGTTWDHPRSRGVYASRGSITQHSPGSSPLARGLRRRLREPLQALGIIPARAGFTLIRTSLRGIPLDHPRSRGVYFTSSGR